MEDKNRKVSAKFAFGEKLPKPISYSFAWKELESIEEAKSADKYPTDKQILKMLNKKSEQSARNAAYIEAMKAAGYERPTAANDEQVRLKDMFKTLMFAKDKEGKPKYTREAARALAADAIGADWDDEEEDDE